MSPDQEVDLRDEVVRLRIALRDADAEIASLRAEVARLRAPPVRWAAERPHSALLEIRGQWVSAGSICEVADEGWHWEMRHSALGADQGRGLGTRDDARAALCAAVAAAWARQ